MVKQKKTEETKPVVEKKIPKKEYIFTVGRRRSAIARVRLYPKGLPAGRQGTGIITVNGKPVEEYFSSLASKVAYMVPFVVTNTVGKFDVTVKVAGGGPNGQLVAVIHGISRAIEKLDKEKHRLLLKKKGLLTRDSRIRERRKVGMGGKARRKKQSPKR